MDRRSGWVTALGAAVLLGACGEAEPVAPPPGGGGGGTPLQVTATSPADAATGVELGVLVTGSLNVAPAAASVTVTSAVLTTGGVEVPRRVTAVASPAAVEIAAPLLPGLTYTATLGTGLRSTDGGALGTAVTWTFTARTPQGAALATTAPLDAQPRLARDSAGVLHAVAYDSVAGDLEYLRCAANCAAAASWTAITIDSTNDAGRYAAIAAGPAPENRIHIVYRDATTSSLRYATCAGDCALPANFARALVDGGSDVGTFPALAVDGDGGLHATYRDAGFQTLRYAYCADACALAANWDATTLDNALDVGNASALAVDAEDRIHAVYTSGSAGTLSYRTCVAGPACLSSLNWTGTTLSPGNEGAAAPALALDARDGVHVTYHAAATGDLRYTVCRGSCAVLANWTAVVIDEAADAGQWSGLAVAGTDRVFVAYWDEGRGDLRYAACASNCTTTARWRLATLETGTDIGGPLTLLRTGSGRIQVLGRTGTAGRLGYFE